MVKITSFESENVKRIKAVQLEPSPNGLTIIGGRNGQGKTSVLDAIAWALGGKKYQPSQPHRQGSVQDPHIRIELSNGLVVERKGKNSDLKVTDPSGMKSGQKILDSLIGEMALNIPKFMNARSDEKADYLLRIIGVGPQLAKLEQEEKQLAAERLWTGQQEKKAKGFADSIEAFPEAGYEEISASELILQQQDILARNGENAAKRRRKAEYEQKLRYLDQRVRDAEEALDKLREERGQAFYDLEQAKRDALDLFDESTEEIEAKLKDIDSLNRQVRGNLDKRKACQEVEGLKRKYKELTDQINQVRENQKSLLDNAPLPLPDLEVYEGQILYKGREWDCMSGSDQLKVAAAICRAMNPQCGFVLLDKLEQMDQQTLAEFGQWLESEGLQAIATRVSTGDECSIIIEDGRVKGETNDKGSNPNSDLGTAWSW